MERDSFICYRSFIDAGITLSDMDRLKFYDRILKYAIYGIDEKTTGISETMFILVKPNLDANNKRFEDGCKGGRPKKPVSNYKKTTGYTNIETTGYENKKPNVEEEEEEEVEVDETEDEKLDKIFSKIPNDQQQKILNSQKRQQVNTRGKSWIGIRNRITFRNDVMDSESFRNLQNFISELTNEEFEARCSLFKKAIDLINKKNLGKYLESFGKNNIQDFTITDFIKKINLFGGKIDQVFKNITQKDNQSKVLRMIHDDDIKPFPTITTQKPKEMTDEERKLAKEQLQKSRDKMFRKIL